MRVALNPRSIDDYRLFLRIKQLPAYRFIGSEAEFPDEYAARLGHDFRAARGLADYDPIPGLFDYQAAIAGIAIRKQKFAAFVRCGLGKTLILLEYARHVQRVIGPDKLVLIVSPLMVVDQTATEARRFYGDSLEMQTLRPRGLQEWLDRPNSAIGITNYESFTRKVNPGRLGCVILDESSLLKSHYGRWGTELIRLGRGLDWKLALTGTPAPNDRIEFANHAVFLDAFPNVNAFLARFFVNRGETQNRWELKPHALAAFYRALSHWCLFLNNPGVYGWKDNAGTIPPIETHIYDVPLTEEQKTLTQSRTGSLFLDKVGGIGSRSVLSQIAKGWHKGREIDSHKPGFIRDLADQYPAESKIIWCHYNEEQARIVREFPDAANITGTTKFHERMELINQFKAGERKVLISKPKILGLGLNLQIATHHIFSGLQDSFEEYHQALSRSNRVGSTKTLHAHLPVTDLEHPLIETVLRKADRVERDTAEQERIFRNAAL